MPATKVCDIVICRMHNNLFCRADLYHSAITHDCNTVANTDRLIKIMRDEYRRLLQYI